MADVAYPEKAFLKLVARRVLGYAREAESRGEKYYDIGTFAPLQCGVRVKYRFEKSPGDYTPVVTLKKHPAFGPDELLQIAAELLEAEAVLRSSKENDLEYVRKSDHVPET